MITPPTETLAHRLARRNRTNNTMSMLSMAVEEMAGLNTEIEHWRERARKAEAECQLATGQLNDTTDHCRKLIAENEALRMQLPQTPEAKIMHQSRRKLELIQKCCDHWKLPTQHGAKITIISNP